MSSEPPCIIDTVVLMYFLLVEEEDLLCSLLAEPVHVPTSVYDPSEEGLSEEALRQSGLLSEMGGSIRHYEVAGGNDKASAEDAVRLHKVQALIDAGRLVVETLTAEERLVSARLQTSDGAAEYGLKAALGPGEAACVAIASSRGWTIVTDDRDALKVMEKLPGGNFNYERVRKLLIRAAETGVITRGDANDIHRRMVEEKGFWDDQLPFP